MHSPRFNHSKDELVTKSVFVFGCFSFFLAHIMLVTTSFLVCPQTFIFLLRVIFLSPHLLAFWLVHIPLAMTMNFRKNRVGVGGAWQGVGGQENRGRGVEEERTGKVESWRKRGSGGKGWKARVLRKR